MRHARAENDLASLPIDEIGRSINAIAVVAVNVVCGVEMVEALVENNGRVGQIAVYYGIAI